MATYTVQPNQNIWDVSIQLYGSIEGVFDLLISNPELNLNDPLDAGTLLAYHDYFQPYPDIVSAIQEEGLIPANGERHVYYKQTDQPLAMLFALPVEETGVTLSLSGKGEMVVDWGDNTPLETLILSPDTQRHTHYFDNQTDVRRIKIYGTFSFSTFDITEVNGEMFLIKPLHVDEWISRANKLSLKSLMLFEETSRIDLRYSEVSDLLPLQHLPLRQLDLRNVHFTSTDVLDQYLTSLVSSYGSRPACTVWLDVAPSEKGMEAIRKLVGEPAWNTVGKWTFIINNTTYTTT